MDTNRTQRNNFGDSGVYYFHSSLVSLDGKSTILNALLAYELGSFLIMIFNFVFAFWSLIFSAFVNPNCQSLHQALHQASIEAGVTVGVTKTGNDLPFQPFPTVSLGLAGVLHSLLLLLIHSFHFNSNVKDTNTSDNFFENGRYKSRAIKWTCVSCNKNCTTGEKASHICL